MQTATLTLTDFLLARIAEDEAWADYNDGLFVDIPDVDSALAVVDPDRLRAECGAKRRIVGMCGADAACVEHYLRRFPDCRQCFAAEQVTVADGNVLRILAEPYADHPDYRSEWRP